MRKAMYLACALALVLAVWTAERAGAAPRCYPDARFVVIGDGLVQDTLTNLVWQQEVSPTQLDWVTAQSHCSGSFRLPTARELASIVDLTVISAPTIDLSVFPSTEAEGFWTSSPFEPPSSSNAWTVNFSTGSLYMYPTENGARVRCVR